MFTGIVTGTARLAERSEIEGGATLLFSAPGFAEALAPGDSVAISGVCLTVTAARGGTFEMQAIRETLARTTLGDIAPGGRVNLERPVRPADPMGGHFVTGHVDATARVLEVEERGAEWLVRVEIPEGHGREIVEKGSIALDGVSLTVGPVGPGDFVVYLIPYTRDVTTLGEVRAGSRLNVETDLLGKHVARILALEGSDSPFARRWTGPAEGSLR